MDAKTCEFMVKRVKQFESLSYEICQLNQCKEEIQKHNRMGIRTISCNREFGKTTTSQLKEVLGEFIDKRIIEIENEMEEI